MDLFYMDLEKSGFIRSIDELGRVAIPVDIRRYLKLNSHDKVQFHIKDGALILKKVNFD